VSLPFVSSVQTIALSAETERSYDQIVLMLGADAPLSVTPVGWPQESMRGIHGHMFDLAVTSDQKDFARELGSYGLSSWPGPGTRYAARIEAWRTPGSPLVLPLALGTTPATAVTRSFGTPEGRRLRICPSFPFDVRPFARRPS